MVEVQTAQVAQQTVVIGVVVKPTVRQAVVVIGIVVHLHLDHLVLEVAHHHHLLHLVVVAQAAVVEAVRLLVVGRRQVVQEGQDKINRIEIIKNTSPNGEVFFMILILTQIAY